jgi:hypothetical protein
MRGDKYTMLRYYAVRALGELGAANPQVELALARIAVRDTDLELRKEAANALKRLPTVGVDTLEALASSFVDAKEDELKVRIIETLGDLGSAKAAELAADFLRGDLTLSLKRRVIQAVSQNPDEYSAGIILDAAADPKAADFVAVILEGYPSRTIRSVVSRRLRTETDAGILSVLNSLDAVLAD